VLDDTRARDSVGGDPAIVRALRELLCKELEALPAELETWRLDDDRAALKDRLHRLDASAGFCGAAVLTEALAVVRKDIDDGSEWPSQSIAGLLDASARTRQALE
jgi:HPt (histidine-containing phosphotransfer) domain-containing protein